MRKIALIILFLEGIGDAVTTYIALRAGYEEMFTISNHILNIFGLEIFTIFTVLWAILRVCLIKWYYRRGWTRFSDLLLVVMILYVGYYLNNNIEVLYSYIHS